MVCNVNMVIAGNYLIGATIKIFRQILEEFVIKLYIADQYQGEGGGRLARNTLFKVTRIQIENTKSLVIVRHAYLVECPLISVLHKVFEQPID